MLNYVQDVDPLSDTVPPRYVVESDEEEDEYNPLHSQSNLDMVAVDVAIVGDLPKDVPLIIASGDGGRSWTKGACLGEQCGAVVLNGVQVRMVSVFNIEIKG